MSRGVAHLIWSATDFTRAGSLYFDAVESETYTTTSQVTTHPVEAGANITDHVREDIESVSLVVFVSNHPTHGDNLIKGGKRGFLTGHTLDMPVFKPSLFSLGNLIDAGINAVKNALFGKPPPPRALVISFSGPFNAVDETLTQLKQLKASATLLEVVSRDWAVDSMVLTSISEPRTSAQGSGANIMLELKRIRIVETSTVRSPIPTEVRGKSITKAGTQGTSDAGPGKSQSMLAKGSDATGLSKVLGI